MTSVFKHNSRESYDRMAHERERHTKEPWKVAERSAFVSLLQAEQKHTLLEIGAGTGQDAVYFQDQGLAVTCIDLHPSMCGCVGKKA